MTNTHVAEAVDGVAGTWLIINETIGVRAAEVVSNAERDTPIKIDAALLQVKGFQSAHWLKSNTNGQLDQRIKIDGYPRGASILDERYRILETSLVNGFVPDLAVFPRAVVKRAVSTT